MSSSGVSPRKVPARYDGARLKFLDCKVRVVEVSIRCLILGLGLLASVLVGTDSQVRTIFSLDKKASFTNMKALMFLVVADGLVAGYSLVQAIRCVVSIAKGSLLFNKSLAWAIFSGDQVMAYLFMSAAAAALQSAMLAEFGQSELQWMKICNLYSKFCSQAGEGIAVSLIVCFSMVTISCMSAFNLFRLYGNNKGKAIM